MNLRRRTRFAPIALVFLLVLPSVGVGQTRLPLDQVLDRMEAAGRQFRTLEADIERTKVTVIVDDHSTDYGKVYFARRGDASRIRLSITRPSQQELLVDEGKARLYFPRINQVQEYDLGENQDKAEFLVIGFGASNASLREYYDVTLAGEETVDGVPTSVLDLKPRSTEVSAMFSTIRLWVDQERWVPVQSRLTEVGGDYLIVKFSNIRTNGRIPESTFELRLPRDVQIIRM
jgi:outer membrane lipoprotein-sorting protein